MALSALILSLSLLIGVASCEEAILLEDSPFVDPIILEQHPIVLPNQIQPAAATIQDAIDDFTWRAGVAAFLGNNTTFNETGLFTA